MISFISIQFLVFASITLLLYFLFPIKYRWLILLTSSTIFYLNTGIESFVFVIYAAITAYITARNIEDIYNNSNPNRKKAKIHLIIGILLILTMLLYAKIGNSFFEALTNILSLKSIGFREIVPLGISYYTFSVIGYITDVYWRREKVEHNFLKFFLYMIYFPQIIQGPIPRYRRLAPQLIEGHPFNYKNLCFGIQRMIWGYFKKMVIADRFAIFTSEVFDNYSSYEGFILVIAILLSAIELYCDFSGCMDIALGFSEIMSIHLDENFRRPFYAKSAAEFWHRWHITLGTWFKDYIYMPIVSSSFLSKTCQKAKKTFGSRFARSLMSVIPLASVWILTGVWHGTGSNYVVWGCYWGLIIIISTVFAPEFKKLTQTLNINTSSKWYHLFQIIRTFFLYVCSRLLTAPGELNKSFEILQRIFAKFNIWVLFDESLYDIGLDRKDFSVGILAVLVLWKISSMQEKGTKVRDKISSYPLVLRWSIYYAGILAIIILGIYGSGHAGNGFVYMYY